METKPPSGRKPYRSLGLPHIQLGRSIRYTAPDTARWIMNGRSENATEADTKELIDALGGLDQLLDEKQVARVTGLSVATLQTDRCKSAARPPSQKAT